MGSYALLITVLLAGPDNLVSASTLPSLIRAAGGHYTLVASCLALGWSRIRIAVSRIWIIIWVGIGVRIDSGADINASTPITAMAITMTTPMSREADPGRDENHQHYPDDK